jgi:hypothetical protein
LQRSACHCAIRTSARLRRPDLGRPPALMQGAGSPI